MSTTESLMGTGQLATEASKDKKLEVKYQLQVITYKPGEGGTSNWQGFIRVPAGTKLPSSGGLFRAKDKNSFILTIEDGRSFKVSTAEVIATVAGLDTYPVNGQQ